LSDASVLEPRDFFEENQRGAGLASILPHLSIPDRDLLPQRRLEWFQLATLTHRSPLTCQRPNPEFGLASLRDASHYSRRTAALRLIRNSRSRRFATHRRTRAAARRFVLIRNSRSRRFATHRRTRAAARRFV